MSFEISVSVLALRLGVVRAADELVGADGRDVMDVVGTGLELCSKTTVFGKG